jgi:hypothetical protein
MADIQGESNHRAGNRKHRRFAIIIACALIAGIIAVVAVDRNDGSVLPQADLQPDRLPDQPPAAERRADDDQRLDAPVAQPPQDRAAEQPSTTTDDMAALPSSRTGDGSERDRLLRQAADADALPSERSLLAGSSVSMGAVRRILPGAEFDALMQQLQSEATNDALAAEVARTYADTIRLQISEAGNRVNLANFACGLKVCIGELSPGARDEDVDAWRSSFNDDPRSPHAVFVAVPASAEDGRAAFRFLFSFDPETNSLLLPPH